MAVYNITNPESALDSVEFTPVSDGNFSFYHLKDAGKKDAVRDWLTKELEHEIVAETMVEGKHVIVTHGARTREQMLKILDNHGDTPKLKIHKDPPNYWAIRGGMSMVGQVLNLASACFQVEKAHPEHATMNPASPKFNPKVTEGMYVRKAMSSDIGMFAVLNLTANVVNMLYGGQKENATNQLHAIKNDINANLNDHITTTERTFDVRDDRSRFHDDITAPKTKLEKLNDGIAKNSVRLGEIGLRFLGAMALVLPTRNIKTGYAALKSGGLKAGWDAAKNPNQMVLGAGGLYLGGKVLSFFSKVPDPYDTSEKSAITQFREDYIFKVGTVIEATAAGMLGYNAVTKKKIGFANPNSPGMTPRTDLFGGIGGVALTTGLAVRYKAKFGTKNLDAEEVFAHATDTLAKTAPEKLPQLMAESSATIKEHLVGEKIEFGEIFTKMMSDMYRYHHVALDNVGKAPDKFVRTLQSKDPYPDQPPIGRHTFARPSQTPADIIANAKPASSFAEKAAASQNTNPTLAV